MYPTESLLAPEEQHQGLLRCLAEPSCAAPQGHVLLQLSGPGQQPQAIMHVEHLGGASEYCRAAFQSAVAWSDSRKHAFSLFPGGQPSFELCFGLLLAQAPPSAHEAYTAALLELNGLVGAVKEGQRELAAAQSAVQEALQLELNGSQDRAAAAYQKALDALARLPPDMPCLELAVKNLQSRRANSLLRHKAVSSDKALAQLTDDSAQALLEAAGFLLSGALFVRLVSSPWAAKLQLIQRFELAERLVQFCPDMGALVGSGPGDGGLLRKLLGDVPQPDFVLRPAMARGPLPAGLCLLTLREQAPQRSTLGAIGNFFGRLTGTAQRPEDAGGLPPQRYAVMLLEHNRTDFLATAQAAATAQDQAPYREPAAQLDRLLDHLGSEPVGDPELAADLAKCCALLPLGSTAPRQFQKQARHHLAFLALWTALTAEGRADLSWLQPGAMANTALRVQLRGVLLGRLGASATEQGGELLRRLKYPDSDPQHWRKHLAAEVAGGYCAGPAEWMAYREALRQTIQAGETADEATRVLFLFLFEADDGHALEGLAYPPALLRHCTGGQSPRAIDCMTRLLGDLANECRTADPDADPAAARSLMVRVVNTLREVGVVSWGSARPLQTDRAVTALAGLIREAGRVARDAGGALDGLHTDASTAGLRAFGLLRLTEMNDPHLLLDPHVPPQAVSAALMQENQQLRAQLANVRQDVSRLEARARTAEEATSTLRSELHSLRSKVDSLSRERR